MHRHLPTSSRTETAKCVDVLSEMGDAEGIAIRAAVMGGPAAPTPIEAMSQMRHGSARAVYLRYILHYNCTIQLYMLQDRRDWSAWARENGLSGHIQLARDAIFSVVG
jgi:hypothetical protein